MADSITEDAFVVITGSNPQAGKKARIRQVRSHITKGYYRKLQHEQQQRKQQRKRQNVAIRAVLPAKEQQLKSRKTDSQLCRWDEAPVVGREIQAPIPFTNNPMLDPDFLGAAMARRVQKFFEVHMRVNTRDQPHINKVLRWAANVPAYMSAKLLYASGWDDVLASGKLSDLTIRQRVITARLLQDTFVSNVRPDARATICTIQLLLGVELLLGNDEDFDRLQKLSHDFIDQSTEPPDTSWMFITKCLSLVEQANCLRVAGNRYKKITSVMDVTKSSAQFQDKPQLTCPLDFSLLTLGKSMLTEDNRLTYALLGDLYTTVSIARNCLHMSSNQSTYDYVASQWEYMLPHVEAAQGEQQGCLYAEAEANDSIIKPLQLSIFILASCLLFGSEGNQRHALATLSAQLRTLFNTFDLRPETLPTWAQFRGALVWCYAIGARFSDPGQDQKWFLVQFLRITHVLLPIAFQEVSKNVHMIVDCMEHVEKLHVEEFDERL